MDERKNFLTEFRFLVTIDEIAVAGFSKVSGLEKRVETEEYEEGGNMFVHKFPKKIVYGNLLLERGLSEGEELWKWYMDVVDAMSHNKPLKRLKKSVTLVILDEKGEATQWVFVFKDAYPVKWRGSDLVATGGGLYIETLEIVHNGFDRT